MLSETEEFLQNIPMTRHADFCTYPCYCSIGSKATLAYMDNIGRICRARSEPQGVYYPLRQGETIEGLDLPPGCVGVTIYGNITIEPVKRPRYRGFKR